MEIWTPRTTSTYSGMDLILNKFATCPHSTISFNTVSYCRQHILLAMVFEDVTKGLTCFW